MAPKVFLVDAFDTGTIGFVVSDVLNWRDGVEIKWPAQKVPGRWGEMIVGTLPEYSPRELRINGTLLADDVATLRANLEELKWRVGKTEKTFTFVDDETYEFIARSRNFQAPGIRPHMVQTGVNVRIRLYMADPRVYAASVTNVTSITSTPKDLPLGNAPVRATVQVTGSGTFTLTYKEFGGATRGTMTITGASAPVDIDMDAQTITDSGGNAAEYLTAGDFFEYDPDDGDDIFGTPDWPTLEVSSGTASTSYYKAYL
jgi:phage-related protein